MNRGSEDPKKFCGSFIMDFDAIMWSEPVLVTSSTIYRTFSTFARISRTVFHDLQMTVRGVLFEEYGTAETCMDVLGVVGVILHWIHVDILSCTELT